MLTITINNKKHKVPSCWAEVTTEQYINLCKHGGEEYDYLTPFSILVGQDLRGIQKTKDYSLENEIFKVINFLYEEPTTWKEMDPPKVLKIDYMTVKIPLNLGLLTLDQSMALRVRIEKAETYDELIAVACAIYLQPLFDKEPFDRDKAAKLEKQILKIPIVLTYSIGFFFLMKYESYGNTRTKAWSLIKRMSKKIEKLYYTWLKHIGWTGSGTYQ